MEVVPNGVSANLCEALAMMIEPFPTLDVSFVWARTQPTTAARDRLPDYSRERRAYLTLKRRVQSEVCSNQ